MFAERAEAQVRLKSSKDVNLNLPWNGEAYRSYEEVTTSFQGSVNEAWEMVLK